MYKLFIAFQHWKNISREMREYDEYALNYDAYDYDSEKDI
jgi:hypothetical protein